MKFLKNRFVIGTLCIIAALLIAFFGNTGTAEQHPGRICQRRPHEAIRRSGTRLTAKMLETARVPETLVEGGISAISSGGRPTCGGRLVHGRLSDQRKALIHACGTEFFPDRYSQRQAGGFGHAAVFGIGCIRPSATGDIVTVMAVSNPIPSETLGLEPADATDEITYNTTASTVIHPELQYVEACMVTTNNGADASVKANPGDDEENSLPVTVSFYVSQ